MVRYEELVASCPEHSNKEVQLLHTAVQAHASGTASTRIRDSKRTQQPSAVYLAVYERLLSVIRWLNSATLSELTTRLSPSVAVCIFHLALLAPGEA